MKSRLAVGRLQLLIPLNKMWLNWWRFVDVLVFKISIPPPPLKHHRTTKT